LPQRSFNPSNQSTHLGPVFRGFKPERTAPATDWLARTHSSMMRVPTIAFLARSALSASISSPINIGILARHPATTRLLDQVHEACITKHYSPRTERVHCRWIARFPRFHRSQTGTSVHPRAMTSSLVESFLTHLTVNRHLAASAQSQALNTIVFLFHDAARSRNMSHTWDQVLRSNMGRIRGQDSGTHTVSLPGMRPPNPDRPRTPRNGRPTAWHLDPARSRWDRVSRRHQ
jgi:hypothetical protein